MSCITQAGATRADSEISDGYRGKLEPKLEDKNIRDIGSGTREVRRLLVGINDMSMS